MEPIIDSSGVVSAAGSPLLARSKVLKLRTIIDDHMMAIKVRQASELIAKGHEVTLIVRLPSRQLNRLVDTPALSEEEKRLFLKVKY